MSDESAQALTDQLVRAFVRLSQGDFSVRLERTFARDTEDLLIFFVNLIAEQLGDLTVARERQHRELEERVAQLGGHFVELAAGDFDVRAPRDDSGDPMDVLAFLFNSMAEEVGGAFREVEGQRSLLEVVFESMQQGILLISQAGLIEGSNRVMAELFDRPVEVLIGVNPLDLVHPGEREMLAAAFRSGLANPIRDLPLRVLRPSGEDILLTLNASARLDVLGQFDGAVAVVRDEREVHEMRARLQMSDRLATMGTVAAGVAHEINNPLAFVLANLDFALEELDTLKQGGALSQEDLEEVLRALDATRGGAQRVRQIVQELKAFSRSDHEDVSTIALDKLVDSAIGFVRNEARHHARLVKELSPTPPVHANEGRLLQVVINLVQNAAHAIPLGDVENQRIAIRTGRTDSGDAFLEVTDTGCGIDPTKLQRIFEAFYTTKPAGVGTGLGLSIVERIVREAGGSIEVDSQIGAGTRFRVILPAASGSSPSPTRARVVHSFPPPAARTRLLIVDDEVEIGRAAERILNIDHDVTVVTSGFEALAEIDVRRYDVVLCDLLMPQLTGMQLFEALGRTHPELRDRMILMSGAPEHAAVRPFLEEVPNTFVAKPFDAATLRRAIRETLGRMSMTPHPPASTSPERP